MTLSFPLTTTQFWGRLRLADGGGFTLDEQRQVTRTRGGEMLVADQGARLWRGQVTLRSDYSHAEAGQVLATLDVLANAGGSFLCFECPKARPAADPTGSILGVSTPTINQLNANARELRIQGLPAGYALTPGDMLMIRIGGNVRSLHRIVGVGGDINSGVANGSGVTPDVEVVPHIRPGAVVGGAVQLIKPVMAALIEPGSIQTGTVTQNWRKGISFSFVQTLRPL